MATAQDALNQRESMNSKLMVASGKAMLEFEIDSPSVEHAQTLSGTVLILGESRKPPVNSRRANEARTSARSCRVSISLHHRPLMRTVFTCSVEAIWLMTS